MLNELSWESFARRRERARLYMMYEVVHGLVDIPWDIPWLQNKVLNYSYINPSAQEDLTLGNLHPSSLTVICLNYHLFSSSWLCHSELLQGGTLRCLSYITTVFNLRYFLLQLTAPNSFFKLLFCATNYTGKSYSVSRVIAVSEEGEGKILYFAFTKTTQ